MDNFNFNLLKYFYYIVLYNGFTNASRNLSVAQPSLSLNVKRLEDELGYKLIERNSKQFELTENGNNLYKSIKPFFESIEDNLKVNKFNSKVTEITIAARYSYSFLVSSTVINRIITDHPNIKINVKLYSKLDIDKLKLKEYDLVIDDLDYLNLIQNANIIKIAELNNYFVCSDKLHSIYKDVKHVSDLNKAQFISYNPSLKNGKFNGLCYNNGVSFVDIISVNESNLYFEYINNSLGIGFTNELFLKEYPEFNVIDVEEEFFKDEIGIAYINENQVLKRIIDIIQENIKEILK